MASTVSELSGPGAIFRLANAFCDAKALLTAVQLNLFGALRDGSRTALELRDELKLHGRGLADFLDLLVSLGLLEKQDERYRNAPVAQRHLIPGSPGYIGGFLRRTDYNRYPAWGRLEQALRTGEPQSEGDFAKVLATPALLEQFVQMMDGLTQVLGPHLIEAFDFSAAHTIVDVGGCRGNVAGQIVKANPRLSGHVFDLPQMEPFFDEHIGYMGLTGRMSFHGGDFFETPLPSGDVVVLGHVLHNWDETQRAFLVRKAFDAVNPGGTLLVYDRILHEDGRNQVENLVISLDMLLVSQGGSEYTVDELRTHAKAAGAVSVTARPLGEYDTLVVCEKN
jgi:hypothetical protein